MTKKYTYLLILIFFLGLFLRFYRLHLNSPELYIDETRGQYLMRLAVLNPILRPSSVPQRFLVSTLSFTSIFGLNPFGVRSAAALLSSFVPLAIYFFFSQIKHKFSLHVAIVGSFLSMILPWSFLIGRIGHIHSPIIVSLICASAYFFLVAKKIHHYFYSLFFLGLAAFYYPSVTFVIPFFVPLILHFATKQISKEQRKLLFAGVTLLILITLAVFFNKYRGFSSSSRGMDLAIWRDPNTLYEVNQSRGHSWLSEPSLLSFHLDPKVISPLLYNKATANISIFTRNYLSFFSPEWLFLKGDTILRHSTGQMGYFYPILLPFLLYGTFRFFKNNDQKTRLLFIVWILGSPLSAAITKDGAGYLLRGVTLLPFLTYFVALGIIDSFHFFKSNFSQLLYSLILCLLTFYSAFYFFYGYFHVYPYQTSTARAYEYGFKELSDFQVANDSATLLIIWDGYYPLGHFVFWQNIPAQEYVEYKLEDVVIGESHFNHPRNNLYFVKPYKVEEVQEFIQKYKPDYLVLPDPYYVHYPSKLSEIAPELVETIKYPNGESNFRIFRLKSINGKL